MNTKKTRLFVFLMTLVMAVSAITFLGIAASASANLPSFSSDASCEIIARSNIPVYRYSNLSTRGTSSPAKSYNASISAGDVCYIYQWTPEYILISYPTSSGYRVGYVSTVSLLGTRYADEYVVSKGKVTTYRTPGGSSYGYTEANDGIWKLREEGSSTIIVYTARSGNRAYKVAAVPTNLYNSTIRGISSAPTKMTGSSFAWPVQNFNVSQSFNRNTGGSRPFHSGMDLVSSNRAISAAGDGRIIYRGYSSGNGNHVVIEHTLNGKTFRTLYSHLADFTGCPEVGQWVTKGTRIGTMGTTGNSTGVHLHFAVYYGTSVNPYGYVDVSNSTIQRSSYGTFINPQYLIDNQKLPG